MPEKTVMPNQTAIKVKADPRSGWIKINNTGKNIYTPDIKIGSKRFISM